MSPTFNDPWHGEHAPRGGFAGGGVTHLPSGKRNWQAIVVTLLVLGAIGYFAVPFGIKWYQRTSRASSLAHTAHAILAKVPTKLDDAAKIQGLLKVAVEEAVAKARDSNVRWYACCGRRGQETIVVHDDEFDKSERAFVEKFVDEARQLSDAAGERHNPFTWPLGAVYTSVSVNGTAHCLVVGWTAPDTH